MACCRLVVFMFLSSVLISVIMSLRIGGALIVLSNTERWMLFDAVVDAACLIVMSCH